MLIDFVIAKGKNTLSYKHRGYKNKNGGNYKRKLRI